MFYSVKIKDYVGINPELFEGELKESLKQQLIKDYSNKNDEKIGFVISIMNILNVDIGFKLPEDSARNYEVEFELLCMKFDINEVLVGKVSSITNFGGFINVGTIDGLIHQSQIMTEKTSINANGDIEGEKSGLILKEGDIVKVKVVAISFKNLNNIKLGLTMRQPGLGCVSWGNK